MKNYLIIDYNLFLYSGVWFYSIEHVIYEGSIHYLHFPGKGKTTCVPEFYIKAVHGVKNEEKYDTVAILSWYFSFSCFEQEYHA